MTKRDALKSRRPEAERRQAWRPYHYELPLAPYRTKGVRALGHSSPSRTIGWLLRARGAPRLSEPAGSRTRARNRRGRLCKQGATNLAAVTPHAVAKKRRLLLRAAGGVSAPRVSCPPLAANSEQRGAAFRAVALPAGPTIRQCHLARVGDGDLLAADAPALWAGVLVLVGVRLNHVRQAYFVATCLLSGSHHPWAAAPRDRGRRPPASALPLRGRLR